MKATILFLLVAFSLTDYQEQEEKKVIICKSTSSNRYHLKKDCRALATCKTEIKETTLKRAKQYGRTLCKWERKEIEKNKASKK